MAEMADQSLLGARDVKSTEDTEENVEPVVGKQVNATQFKKKLAKEVKDIVDDSNMAELFLRNVAAKKLERKRRNIRAMIMNSTNPEKQEVDFVKSNVVDFRESQDLRKQKK